MNERIKELVKQAGFFVLSNGKIYIPTTSEEITDCQIKFAELIVQECANLLVKEAKSSHDEGSETYDTLIRESNWMKRYFGVE